MPTTFADLVRRAKGELDTTQRLEINVLSEALDAVETDVDFADAAGPIVRGSILQIDDECMFVRSVTGQTATVIRGWNATTAAAHDSGEVIETNPRWPNQRVLETIIADIRSWPTMVFTPTEVDVTFAIGEQKSSAIAGLTEDPFHVVAVQYIHEDRAYRQTAQLRLDDTDVRVVLHKPAPASLTATAVLAMPFELDAVTSATEINDTGLDEALGNAAVYGACWRLLGAREAKRTFTEAQGRSRAAEEVPPMATMRAAEWFRGQRDLAISTAAVKIRERYPLLSS